MLSEGRIGIDDVFCLRNGRPSWLFLHMSLSYMSGNLQMFLEKETYERAGLVGKPHGAKGDRGLKPRWSAWRPTYQLDIVLLIASKLSKSTSTRSRARRSTKGWYMRPRMPLVASALGSSIAWMIQVCCRRLHFPALDQPAVRPDMCRTVSTHELHLQCSNSQGHGNPCTASQARHHCVSVSRRQGGFRLLRIRDIRVDITRAAWQCSNPTTG